MSILALRKERFTTHIRLVITLSMLLMLHMSNTGLPAAAAPDATAIVMLSAGSEHACALVSGGRVKCWGANGAGELGDGTTIDRGRPQYVPDLPPGIQAVTAGPEHTCVLTASHGVKCWGDNRNGELGDGTTTERHAAVDVVGLTGGVQAIIAGGTLNYAVTCAILMTGALQCWGSNLYGHLGDGTVIDRHTPTDVVGLGSGVTAVAIGSEHACALTTRGVKCWGDNLHGELGNGSSAESHTPVDVVGLGSGVIAIVAGYQSSCAVTAVGGAKCWGMNAGDGTNDGPHTPTNVVGLTSGVSAMTSNSLHTCALMTAGGVKCWGSNHAGELGDGTTTVRLAPVDAIGLSSGVARIEAGSAYTCALKHSGTIACWGENYSGVLGDTTISYKTAPFPVVGLNQGVAGIRAGRFHTCALTTQGGVKCWGENAAGELGDGTNTEQHMPVSVSGLSSGVVAVAAAGHSAEQFTCALTGGGGMKCWGANGYGELGDGSTNEWDTPVDVLGLTAGVKAIAAGASAGAGHACALTVAGGVKCWGDNGFGQLGDGTFNERHRPVDVLGMPSGIARISTTGNHTCAVSTTGSATCWGYDDDGQLGSGRLLGSSVPVNVLFWSLFAPVVHH